MALVESSQRKYSACAVEPGKRTGHLAECDLCRLDAAACYQALGGISVMMASGKVTGIEHT